jgi:hypothetical protein
MTWLTTIEAHDESHETKVGWHREYAIGIVIAPAQVLISNICGGAIFRFSRLSIMDNEMHNPYEAQYTPEQHEVIMDKFMRAVANHLLTTEGMDTIESSCMRAHGALESITTYSRSRERLDAEEWEHIKAFTTQLFSDEDLSAQDFALQFIDVPNQIIIIKKVTN